jgi:peptide chain release factor 3
MNRRTFAIISHPDAGKTTLTEKLLLAGGAIRTAGAVKARGERRRTRSDWMDIERTRGISVSTSVMTFERNGVTYNLLDTPGHEDFSEDTYRTLTAVDSAVMVIDAAKGIEPQTLKLFEVCRLRDVPIVTFVNKMDREAKDLLGLLDEIGERLALDVSPLTWPVGMGVDFRGCYDLVNDALILLPERRGDWDGDRLQLDGLDDPRLDDVLGEIQAAQLREEVELVRAACPPFDPDAYREGHMTPVVFGSALREFGVSELLDSLERYAPGPRPQPAEPRRVEPDEDKLAGFVFKVQANMDANHRDRVAFMRVCSGRFRRGMKLRQVRTGKTVALHNPILFFAHDRVLAEEALPGDIIGIPNHGTVRVGDAFTEGEAVRFTGLPNFAPEILRRVRPVDPLRVKHLRRALESLAEEGVVQIFRPAVGADWIVGAVGQLQIDVLMSRLKTEYNVEASFEPAPFLTARWVYGEDAGRFQEAYRSGSAWDADDAVVFLPRNAWEMQRAQDDWPGLSFKSSREMA